MALDKGKLPYLRFPTLILNLGHSNVINSLLISLEFCADTVVAGTLGSGNVFWKILRPIC